MSSENTQTDPNPLDAIKYAARTDIGMRREENQDAFGVIENANYRLFVVADGMGGVKGGAIASSIAIEVLKASLESKIDISENDLCHALELANSEILAKGAADTSLTGMGTTCVALVFSGTRMYITNVGDSRAYRIRRDKIKRLTEDHTLVQELLRSGTINTKQAKNHPVSHMLTRSLGPTAEVLVDCQLCDNGPARGDIYILCSDGLYNMIRDKEILSIIQEYTLEDAVSKLIMLANDRGGTDNVTVIGIEIGDEFPMGVEDYPAEAVVDDQPELDDYVMGTEELNGSDDTAHTEQDAEHMNGHAQTDQTQNESTKHTAAKPGENVRLKSKISLESLRAKQAEGQPLNGANKEHAEDEKIEEELVPNEQPNQSSHIRTWLLVLGVFVICGLIGSKLGYVAKDFLNASDTGTLNIVRIGTPVKTEYKIADVQLESAENEASLHLQQSLLPSVELALAGSIDTVKLNPEESNDSTLDGVDLGTEQRTEIKKRQTELESLVQDLDKKLLAFETGGAAVDSLQSVTTQAAELKQKREGLNSEIDIATRKLSVWFGRRTRLKETDPVNLASEVAVSSELVKEKKDLFEKATWAYLKESEILKYNPSDQKQKEKVGQLIRVRKERMLDLANEVRQAIERAIGDADQKVAELILERDRIEAKLKSLERELNYAKIMTGSDAKARDAKKSELIRERDVAVKELEQLNQLLPQ